MRIIEALWWPSLIGVSAVSLLVLSAGGCSKHSSLQAGDGVLAQNVADLGKVELEQGTPKQFDLGDGRTCTLTGRQVLDSIEVEIVVLSKNADGSVQRLQMPRLTTLPGRKCVVSAGDTAIALTPTLIVR